MVERRHSRALWIALAVVAAGLAGVWCGVSPERPAAPVAALDEEPRAGTAVPAAPELESEPVTPDDRSVPEGPGIVGRIVDPRTGLGVPDWGVRLVAMRPQELNRIVLPDRASQTVLVGRETVTSLTPGTHLELGLTASGEISLKDLTEVVRQRHLGFEPPEGFPKPPLPVQGLQLRPARVGSRFEILPGGGTFRLVAPKRREVLGETRTDREGRFRFPRPEDDELWLEADLDSRGYLDPGKLELTENVCDGEFAWRATVVAGGIFRGRVLDARTFLPVPGLDVALTGERVRRETVGTDEDGRFETAAPIPDGRITAEVSDGGERVACENRIVEFRAGSDEPAPDLLAWIGPTYHVRARLPDGSVSGDLRIRFHGLEPEPDARCDGNPFLAWRDLEEDGHADLRYPARPVRSGGGPVVAEVVREDGLLGGAVGLSSFAGGPADPVEVVLGPRSILEGVVLGTEGRPLEGARVVLRHRDGTLAPDAVSTGADGTFELRGLDPVQAWRVEAEHPALGARHVAIDLRAGERTAIEIRF